MRVKHPTLRVLSPFPRDRHVAEPPFFRVHGQHKPWGPSQPLCMETSGTSANCEPDSPTHPASYPSQDAETEYVQTGIRCTTPQQVKRSNDSGSQSCNTASPALHSSLKIKKARPLHTSLFFATSKQGENKKNGLHASITSPPSLRRFRNESFAFRSRWTRGPKLGPGWGGGGGGRWGSSKGRER